MHPTASQGTGAVLFADLKCEGIAMIDVQQITKLHQTTVARWHDQPIDNPFDGLMATVCKQHSFNFLLWHEEDIARSRDVTDSQIARVKRSIDKYNQLRNDWIEKIDDELTSILKLAEIRPQDGTALNTETPGSVMDRLSIMSLRIYHLDEQLNRDDVDQKHIESVQHKLAICHLQRDDLANSLQQLADDIFAGRKRHRTYRQCKMYNDPTLNPYLYAVKSENQPERAAAAKTRAA